MGALDSCLNFSFSCIEGGGPVGSEERMTGRELSMDFTSTQHKYADSLNILVSVFSQIQPHKEKTRGPHSVGCGLAERVSGQDACDGLVSLRG